MTDQIVVADEHPEHCYRCCLQLTNDVKPQTYDGHCPRCGYDLTIIDISEELATEEQLKAKRGEREMYDLIQMVHNWGKAQRRYIDRVGVDWSAPHDMIQDIGEMMMPWIARLVQAGYFGKGNVSSISAIVDHEVEKLIHKIEAEEDILRLTGQWSENEEEIKKYWEEKLPIIRKLSMRNEQRIACNS